MSENREPDKAENENRMEAENEGREPRTENQGHEGEEGEGGVELPPEWAEIDFESYFRKGFRPHIKVKPNGRMYIVLRKGDEWKSLGPYDERRWELLQTAARAMGAVKEEGEEERGRGEAGGGRRRAPSPSSALLSVTVAKPPPLSKSITITPKTLIYYTWLVDKGYDGTLGDFLNECVEAYFKSKGIEPVMYREEYVEDEE